MDLIYLKLFIRLIKKGFFIAIFFAAIWLFVSIVDTRNNPLILSADVHQASLLGGAIERGITEFLANKKSKHEIELDIGKGIELSDIRANLVDLDNDVSTIEVLSVIKKDGMINNTLYIIQLNQDLEGKLSKSAKLIGILRNINIPVSLKRNTGSKWLDVVNTDRTNKKKVFSFISKEYQLIHKTDK